jgi:hypothetical protein
MKGRLNGAHGRVSKPLIICRSRPVRPWFLSKLAVSVKGNYGANGAAGLWAMWVQGKPAVLSPWLRERANEILRRAADKPLAQAPARNVVSRFRPPAASHRSRRSGGRDLGRNFEIFPGPANREFRTPGEPHAREPALGRPWPAGLMATRAGITARHRPG